MSRSSVTCVDASLVVRFLLGPQSEEIRSLWKQWDRERRDLVAPALIHFEILNALYQYERHGKLSTDTISEAVDVALGLPIRLYSDSALHLRAIQITRRFALPASYDAHYLALAERLGTELWTCDARLVKKVGADLSWVHLAPGSITLPPQTPPSPR
jgi:predicted nucleic acid-binding protein